MLPWMLLEFSTLHSGKGKKKKERRAEGRGFEKPYVRCTSLLLSVGLCAHSFEPRFGMEGHNEWHPELRSPSGPYSDAPLRNEAFFPLLQLPLLCSIHTVLIYTHSAVSFRRACQALTRHCCLRGQCHSDTCLANTGRLAPEHQGT